MSSSEQTQVDEDDDSNEINVEECDGADNECCDVAVAQINYPNLNKQDSIEQVRGQSHEKILVQIFILYDVHLGGIVKLSIAIVNRKIQSMLNQRKLKFMKKNKPRS